MFYYKSEEKMSKDELCTFIQNTSPATTFILIRNAILRISIKGLVPSDYGQ